MHSSKIRKSLSAMRKNPLALMFNHENAQAAHRPAAFDSQQKLSKFQLAKSVTNIRKACHFSYIGEGLWRL